MGWLGFEPSSRLNNLANPTPPEQRKMPPLSSRVAWACTHARVFKPQTDTDMSPCPMPPRHTFTIRSRPEVASTPAPIVQVPLKVIIVISDLLHVRLKGAVDLRQRHPQVMLQHRLDGAGIPRHAGAVVRMAWVKHAPVGRL